MLLLNIFKNAIKPGFIKVMVSKLIKRFEKDTSLKALKWAEENVTFTTEEFCKIIDKDLWKETIIEVKNFKQDADKILSKIDVSLGGGGNYYLLYFLTRKISPKIVVETGVAAGWSSLSILRAFQKCGCGYLYSSDFPYFRFNNPEYYIGIVTKNELNLNFWDLDLRGDKISLPAIKSKIECQNVKIALNR